MFLSKLFRKGKRKQKEDLCAIESTEDDDLSQCEDLCELIYGFSAAVISDVGRRENNEDNYVLANNINWDSSEHREVACSFAKPVGRWCVAGVFDGMGGGELGELASHCAAEIFLKPFADFAGPRSKTEVDMVMCQAFLEANNHIRAFQKEHRIYGTTGTVLCTNGVEFKIYHLGDSRAYFKHDDRLVQITKDQTLAQMKIDIGMYQQDDPSADADRNKLTEYIGRDGTKKNLKPVESLWIPIQKKDIILLCSDGLHSMCSDEEIHQILCKDMSAAETAMELVNAAKMNGGTDNITAMVFVFS